MIYLQKCCLHAPPTQLLLSVNPQLGLTSSRCVLAYLLCWGRLCSHGLISLKQLLSALRCALRGSAAFVYLAGTQRFYCCAILDYPYGNLCQVRVV